LTWTQIFGFRTYSSQGVYTEKGMHSEAVAEAKKAAELSGNSQ
jgi:hypothetical protein